MLTRLELYNYALSLAMERGSLTDADDAYDDRAVFLNQVYSQRSARMVERFDWATLRETVQLVYEIDPGIELAGFNPGIPAGSVNQTGYQFQYRYPDSATLDYAEDYIVRLLHPRGGLTEDDIPFEVMTGNPLGVPAGPRRIILTNVLSPGIVDTLATPPVAELAYARCTRRADMTTDAELARMDAAWDEAMSHELAALLVAQFSSNANKAALYTELSNHATSIARSQNAEIDRRRNRTGKYARARR